MLEIKNLTVQIDNKKILDKLNINVESGKVHVIMGPNGTGKSTLSKVIMANKKYKVLNGTITYNNEDITNCTTDEISRKGIFLLNQNPLEIEGISNQEFLRTAINSRNDEPLNMFEFIKEIEQTAKELNIKSELLHRSINVGFSGGEKKKNEMLQLKMLKPKLVILDELDSGLDVDSLNIVCQNINEYKESNSDVTILIITHYPKILELIKPDIVSILLNGTIVKTGGTELSDYIFNNGYKSLNNSTFVMEEVKEDE